MADVELVGIAPARLRVLLVLAIFVAAASGLIYELVAGTLGSYLLGDSVAQFSLAIGLFLAAMGLGSYITRWIADDELSWLILLEVLLGVLGGATALAAFAAFAFTDWHRAVLHGGCIVTGTLVGMELPLVVRLVRRIDPLPAALGTVLGADYLGALGAALLFPFLLLPHLGLARACAVAGLANVLVAGLLVWRLRAHLPARGFLGRRVLSWCCAIGLVWTLLLVAWSPRVVEGLHGRFYQDEVILSRRTAHQQMVITRWRDDVRLYLDGHLQFSSVDEYRYHESLVHVALGLAQRPVRRVLVLGGGDGLVLRELFRRPGIEQVELIDLDPEVVDLFRNRDLLRQINGSSLSDPRVTVRHRDAFRHLLEGAGRWDAIIGDLPDPSEAAIGKLYSREFYAVAARSLNDGGVLAVQATSPFRSRAAYWCVARTMRAAGDGLPEWTIKTWNAEVPTFGTWGFVAGVRGPAGDPARSLPAGCRFLTPELIPGLFAFPSDMSDLDGPVSTLDLPEVVRLYRDGYHRYFE